MRCHPRWAGLLGLLLAAGCGRSGVFEAVPSSEEGPRFPLPDDFGDWPTDPETPKPTPTPALSQCALAADPDLIGCWSFDGSFADGSSQASAVTVSAVSFGSGPAGSSAVFGGGSAFSVASNPAFNLTEMTVETWVRLAALPPSSVTLLHRSPTIRISVTPTGAAECRFDNSELSASADGAVQPGQWTHVACTFEPGNEFLVWVNAVSADPGGADGGPGSSTVDLRLGARTDDTERFTGELDVVRLWRRLLTPTELCAAAGKTC